MLTRGIIEKYCLRDKNGNYLKQDGKIIFANNLNAIRTVANDYPDMIVDTVPEGQPIIHISHMVT